MDFKKAAASVWGAAKRLPASAVKAAGKITGHNNTAKAAVPSLVRLEQRVEEPAAQRSNLIVACALCAAMGLSFAFVVLMTFGLSTSYVPVLIIATLLPLAFCILLTNRRFGRYVPFAALLLAALICAALYSAVWDGWMQIADDIADTAAKAGRELSYFETSGEGELIALVPLLLIVSLASGYGAAKRAPLFAVVLTALPVLVGLCMSLDPPAIPMIALAALWAALIVFSTSVGRPPARKSLRPLYIGVSGEWLFAVFGGLAAVVACVMLLVCPPEAHETSKGIESFKNTLLSVVDSVRYGSDETPGLTGGRLRTSVEFDGSSVMTVKMDTFRSLHLRTMVGNSFSGGKWSGKEPQADEKYAHMFDWFDAGGFDPDGQLAALGRMEGQTGWAKVTLKNKALSRKYIYAPYSSLIKLAGTEGDGMTNASGLFGSQEYTYRVLAPAAAQFTLEELRQISETAKQSADYADHAKYESAYRSYVYENYLAVSDKDKATLSKRFEIDVMNGKDAEELAAYIQRQFAKGYTLTDNDAADSLEGFLNGTRRGTEAHFATAAALLLRASGVPARYAEGYYISPQKAYDYTDKAGSTMKITDTMAHSWVEIYAPEIGWLPLEVVPGYYSATSPTGDILSEEESDTHRELAPVEEDDDSVGAPVADFPYWIIPIVIVVLAVAALVLLRMITIKKRKTSFAATDKTAAVLAVYAYIMKLLHFDGVDIDKDAPLKSSAVLSDKYRARFDYLFDDVFEARFSQHSPGYGVLDDMKAFANNLAGYIYKHSGFFKKLRMRWLSWLI